MPGTVIIIWDISGRQKRVVVNLTNDIVPGVSVIIPTYNRTRYLSEALTSLLQQTKSPQEIIVVNDGSGEEYLDELNEICKISPLITRIDCEKNSGVSAARNLGIKKASGEFICFLDDDDQLHPEFIERMLNVLERENDVDAVICETEILPSGNRKASRMRKLLRWRKRLYSEEDINTASYFLIHCPMVHSFLFRRKLFEQFQFQEDLRYGEDMYLWLQMVHGGIRFQKIDWPGSYVRVHDDNAAYKLDYGTRNLFYEKLEGSGMLVGRRERYLHYLRWFFFKISHGRLPGMRLILKIVARPLELFKFVRMQVMARF